MWRRSGVPPSAIEKLADADAFHALRHDRRQALWRVRGLGEKPLPLFAAADAREGLAGEEGAEEAVTLKALTEGREVVEDYRTFQLSLRAHPLSFLRDDLRRRGVVSAADLERIKDGRHVEVAGIMLVRQKPGSAKGILFMTIEDETGVANGILWPDRFEAQRRTVLSSAMVGLKGRLQKEGIVTHIIIDKGGRLAASIRVSVSIERCGRWRWDAAAQDGLNDWGHRRGWPQKSRAALMAARVSNRNGVSRATLTRPTPQTQL